MKSTKSSNEEKVELYAKSLSHPLKELVATLREVIKSADPLVGEHIKWNSISYFINAELQPFNAKEYKRDILVINLSKPAYILLVFPTGQLITDQTGLLEGDFPDTRKVVKITSQDDLLLKSGNLKLVIQKWINQSLS